MLFTKLPIEIQEKIANFKEDTESTFYRGIEHGDERDFYSYIELGINHDPNLSKYGVSLICMKTRKDIADGKKAAQSLKAVRRSIKSFVCFRLRPGAGVTNRSKPPKLHADLFKSDEFNRDQHLDFENSEEYKVD